MSDTPETEAFQKTEHCAYDSMWRQFAKKLERERNKARFDLAFRLERNTVQQLQLSEARKQLAEMINKKY